MQKVGGKYAQKEFKEVHDATTFGTEIAIHAKCRHPNLICYTENPIHGNYNRLLEPEEMTLMQYIDLDRFKSAADPAWRAVQQECFDHLFAKVDIMLEISKGMESICSQGIRRQDLRTENLLVTELPRSYSDSSNYLTRVLSNEPLRLKVKLSDFGVQKDFAPYIEYKGSGAFTEKADVLSFAMVCSEILTGEAPFRLKDLQDRLLSGERPQLPSRCPSYLVDLIKQCWHRNPEERPTFATISRSLRHLMAVLLISADPNSTHAGLLTNMYSSNWIETPLRSQLGTNWPLFGHCTSSTLNHTSLHMSWCQTATQQAQCYPTQPSIKSKAKITKLSALEASIRSSLVLVMRSVARLILCRAKDNGDVGPPPITMHNYPDQYSNGSGSLGALKRFTYKELYAATHSFGKADQIGKGSSGCVFKGKLGDGRMVAVKVMEGSSKKRHKDGFFTELASLGKLRHCNLVPLLGWCWEKGNLMLVYEYISRGDLHRLLFGQVQKLFLSLEQRYKIVYGLASALHYLHFQCAHPILHRDVNPNNILLDNDYNARLGDFGLAIDLEQTNAQVTTCAMGTLGYIAPEYVLAHKLGREADVYSFGVVVLELACGKRLFKISPGEVTNVVPFVWNLYTQNRLLDAGDERLNFKTDIKKEDMERLLLLGLACTQCNIVDRPNMELVLRILSKEVQPPTPAHAPYGTY